MVKPTLSEMLERLTEVLSHPSFLEKKGLANEVPIFIQTYKPEDEEQLQQIVRSLATRLRNKGIGLVVEDLFNLLLERLESDGQLEKILQRESTLGKKKLISLLNNLSDPKTRLIPMLTEKVQAGNARLTLITGVGRVFPFLRTHTILENLQPAMKNHPIVMFFPGEYVQDKETGSELHLFGSAAQPPLHRAYYRAINLEHYRI